MPRGGRSNVRPLAVETHYREWHWSLQPHDSRASLIGWKIATGFNHAVGKLRCGRHSPPVKKSFAEIAVDGRSFHAVLGLIHLPSSERSHREVRSIVEGRGLRTHRTVFGTLPHGLYFGLLFKKHFGSNFFSVRWPIFRYDAYFGLLLRRRYSGIFRIGSHMILG